MKHKPLSETYEVRVSVIFEDRHTRFLVTSSGKDRVLKMSNDKVQGKKELDKSEIELLLQTYEKFPPATIFQTTVIDRERT